jgi:putative PIN family toxin of toxin-antitoxin system
MTSLRFVFDTNVLISAVLFSRSRPRLALSAARQSGVVLASSPVLEELSQVLERPKIAAYVQLEERRAFLDEFIRQAEPVTIEQSLRVCRDPKDDKFLELSVAGAADVLITGDADLLVLGRFQQTEILTPAALLERLGKSAGGP